jgi:hypothetical protein
MPCQENLSCKNGNCCVNGVSYFFHDDLPGSKSEEKFSKPRPTKHPLWLLIAGIVFTMVALLIWPQ